MTGPLPVETLRLRHASLIDAKRLFDWSTALEPDAPTAWGEPVWDDHLVRLERTLGRTDRLIFIGEAVRTDQAIGAVRFDAIGKTLWAIDILVAPEFRGRGWSRKLLSAGLDHFDEADFAARLPLDDLRARALFAGMGFERTGATAGSALYRLSRRLAA
jgi:GNAT superfamily N-acetyltransferase